VKQITEKSIKISNLYTSLLQV